MGVWDWLTCHLADERDGWQARQRWYLAQGGRSSIAKDFHGDLGKYPGDVERCSKYEDSVI